MFKKIVAVIFSILMILCLFGCGSSNKNDEMIAKYYDEAKSLIESGDYESASSIIDEAEEKYGESELISSLKKKLPDSDENSDMVEIPDPSDMDPDEMKAKLEELGLECEFAFSGSSASENYITGTVPEAGEKVEKGSTVTVYINNNYDEDNEDSDDLESNDDGGLTIGKISCAQASFQYDKYPYNAASITGASFLENPYIEDGYIYLPLYYYDLHMAPEWSNMCTAYFDSGAVAGQVIPYNDGTQNIMLKINISGLSNQRPSVFTVDVPFGFYGKIDKTQSFDFSIIW